MHSHFEEHDTLHGHGRCRVCDFLYCRDIMRELREHVAFHGAFLSAARNGTAPMTRAARDTLRREGIELQRSPHLEERVLGAVKWLVAHYHDHLERFLLYGVERLAFRAFYLKYVEHLRKLGGPWADDVAQELHRRYPDHAND